MIHPQQDDVVKLIRQGLNNTQISRRLRIDRQTVGGIRYQLNLPPAPPCSIADLKRIFDERTSRTDDGHLRWTGARTRDGHPVVRHHGRMYTARQLGYLVWHGGRKPKGYVKAECGDSECVDPEHCDDAVTRQKNRAVLRALIGRGERPALCAREHDQAEHGRLTSDGRSTCLACKKEQQRERERQESDR